MSKRTLAVESTLLPPTKRNKTSAYNSDRSAIPVQKQRTDYTVGWICALPKEQTAATAMLDCRHRDVLKPSRDPNTYTLGSIGQHNIVIACLFKGQIGTGVAATVATWMQSSFPCVKFGMMVGIGGGVPPRVRLGDVVVGTPSGQYPGVVQWDFGKATQARDFRGDTETALNNSEGIFERTGSLDNPPQAVLSALTKLETDHELVGSRVPEFLEELRAKFPRLDRKYLRSEVHKDLLFRRAYHHISKDMRNHSAMGDEDGENALTDDDESEDCQSCDTAGLIKRTPREFRVLHGLIASGNQVVKDAYLRDRINRSLNRKVLCLEMEAAGLMNNFPCVVIRGICDYADSHKNDVWQEHAAAVAAAVAKELLGYIQPSEIADNSLK